MDKIYDICVDYDTLSNLEYKIDLILYDLRESIEKMTQALQNSQMFLAGKQYDKAVQTTTSCLQKSKEAENNLVHAKDYLKKLQDSLIEYEQCSYKGAET